MTMMWTDDEIRAMDMYLWLDYTIEILWLNYALKFEGQHSVTLEEEAHILKIMSVVYDMETKIIDLIDKYNITFSMIDSYKEINDVRDWPTRFC